MIVTGHGQVLISNKAFWNADDISDNAADQNPIATFDLIRWHFETMSLDVELLQAD